MKNGIVLAVEKLVHSKLLIPEANRRIYTVDKHIGIVNALQYPDVAPQKLNKSPAGISRLSRRREASV